MTRRCAVLAAAGLALSAGAAGTAAQAAGARGAALTGPSPGTTGTAGTDSDGSSLTGQQQQLQSKLAQASTDIEGDTAATTAAKTALAAASAQLPAASAALAAAQTRLASAHQAATLAAAAVQADTIRLAEDAAARAVTAQQIAADHARLDAAVRTSFEAGPIGLAKGALTATSPDTLVDNQAAISHLGDATADALADLKSAQAAQDAVDAADRQAQADLLKQQAEVLQAEKDATAAEAASAATAEHLQSLVHQRQAALATVQSQLAQDTQNYDELQAESDHIAALLQAQAAAEAAAAAQTASASGTTTAVAPKPGPSGLLWPTPGPVTSPFGYRVDPVTHQRALHAGVDIGAPEGQAIEAAQAGTVAFAGQEQGYGNYTCIDHGGGFATCYAHQSKILVSVGQVVKRGQEIGLVGETGYATGPHLHFETRVNGTPVDPMQYF